MSLLSLLPQEIFAMLLVFARVGVCIMFLPGMSEAFVPMRMRLMLALGVSLVLTPLVDVPAIPTAALMTFVWLAREILVGLLLGMVARLMLSAMDVAGNIIATQSGIANAMLLNPAMTQQAGIVSVFLTIMGAMAVLAADLHHLAIIALKQSYAVIPVLKPVIIDDFTNYISKMVQFSFDLGVRLAAPLLVVGLVFNLGLGILNRLMPQIQIFFVGAAAQTGLGIFIFMVSLGLIIPAFLERYQFAYQDWMNF
jgi:flagellar biosynthesis protein FliR